MFENNASKLLFSSRSAMQWKRSNIFLDATLQNIVDLVHARLKLKSTSISNGHSFEKITWNKLQLGVVDILEGWRRSRIWDPIAGGSLYWASCATSMSARCAWTIACLRRVSASIERWSRERRSWAFCTMLLANTRRRFELVSRRMWDERSTLIGWASLMRCNSDVTWSIFSRSDTWRTG